MLFFVWFMLLFIFSLMERVRRKREKGAGKRELPVEPRPSPLAEALGELLAVAGGIYLALLMAVSFLGLEIPERIRLGSLLLEPLAALSVVLALLQPWLDRLWFRSW
ncbi:MAG TPA: hypothetical protein GX518_02305 [Firmicutes bacterium]|nr:hypothetical protein [Bacillota bacterium]